MAEKEGRDEKMVKKSNKKKAGIIAGSIVAAGIVAGGATIGILAATAKVTVSYETGLDSITFKNDTIKKGDSANLPTPMRPGYKFLGWYLDADGNVPANASTKFSKDTTLYAQWRANEYSVILKDEELNTEIATTSYKAAYNDRNLNTLNLPILPNASLYGVELYTFKGWANEKGEIVANVNDSINGITIPYSVKLYGETLYAAWEGREVDIYFGEDKVATKALGKTLALNQGASGDFYNWKVNSAASVNWKNAGAPGAEVKLTKELLSIDNTNANDPKVIIKDNKPIIEFSAETGTVGAPEYSVLGESHTATEELENVTREGYTFDGWYLDTAFKTRVVKTEDEAHELGLEAGSYVVGIPTNTGRVVLYANMLARNVVVNYDYGNAELREGFASTTSDTFKAGERILLPAHARNYVGFNVDFVGWEYNGTRQAIGEAFVVPTNETSITLKAVWGSAYNLLNFNLQGGALGSGETIAYDYNELKTYPMPDVTVSKLGYEFVGWSLSPNTVPSDTANIIKANGEYTVTAQTTLYAIWKAKQYTVDYNLNNGVWAGAGNQTNALYGNDITLTNTPTRAGYTFVRWDVTYYNASGSSYLVPVADKGVLSITGNAIESVAADKINVAAVWEANSYFFKIDNLASETDAQYVTIKDAAGNPITYNYSGVLIPYDSTVTIDVASMTAKKYYNKVIGAYLDDGSAVINDDTGAYTADKMYAKDEVKNEISFTFAEFDATTPGSTVNYKINREADRVKVVYTWEGGSKEEEQTSYYNILPTATGDSASVLNLKDYLTVTGATDTKNSAGNYFYYWVVTEDETGKDYYFDGNGVPIAGKEYNENLFNGTQTINNLINWNEAEHVGTITVKAYYGAPIYATVRYVDYDGSGTPVELKYDVTAVDGSLTKTIYINNRANEGEKDNTAMPEKTRDGYTFDGWSLAQYNVIQKDGNWVIDPDYAKSESLNITNETNLEADLVRTVYAHYTPNSYNVYIVDEHGVNSQNKLLSEKITVQPTNSLISQTYSLSKDRIISLTTDLLTTGTISGKQYDLVGFTYTADQELGSAATDSSVIIYGTQGTANTPALVDTNGDGTPDALYIYIVWREQEYKYIAYYANNGEGTSTKAQMYDKNGVALGVNVAQYSVSYNTLEDGVTIEKADFLKAPTRVGYSFAGWVNKDGVEVETITFTKSDPSDTEDDITYKLYAKWNANTYNVVYYNASNNVYNSLTDVLTFDGTYTLTQTLSADGNGNDFIGWAYGIDVTNLSQVVTAPSDAALGKLLSGGSVKIDATLLARLLSYASATEASWNRNVNFYPIFATPAERYVTLTGLTAPDNSQGFNTTESSIVFKENIYGKVVHYGATDEKINIADLINDLNTNKRVITAYRVDSITYTVGGTTHTAVKDGFINLTWGDEAPVVTLNWVEDQVNLTFDLNDGSGTTATIKSIINSNELINTRLSTAVTNNEITSTLAESMKNPTHKDGGDENGYPYYTFLGWATTADATAAEWKANVTGDSNKYEQTNKVDTTLYAVWQENFVTIEFEGGNSAIEGTLPTSIRVVMNTQARAAQEYKLWEDDSNFSLANHNFGGWAYSSSTEGAGVINVGETLTNDLLNSYVTGGIKNDHLILTANWKRCLTDGTNNSVDYFTADGKINWEQVEADGITEISLPTTIHGTSLTALSASTLTINNNSVTAVYLPKTIVSIDEGAIVSNSLTNVVIPSSVSRIGAGAIVSSNLTSLTISNKTVNLAGNPVKADSTATTHNFATYNLKTYATDTAKTKAESDYSYKLVNGCILSTAGNRLIAVPQTYAGTTFNFEEVGFAGVSSIATYAFSGVSNITSLSFSDIVSAVNAKAIGNMPNLTTLTLSDSIAISQTELFDKGVTKLSNISGGVSTGIYADSQGNLAYIANYTKLVKVNASTTELTLTNDYAIAEFALDGMSALTNLTLEAGTEHFAEQLKYVDHAVNTVSMNWTEATSANVTALSNPVSLTLGSGVTSVANSAFENANRLATLTLGTNITSIGASAFKGIKISSLTVPSGVTTIGASAFENCASLTSLTTNGNETSVGINAFAGTALNTVGVYNNLSVYQNAFGSISAVDNIVVKGDGVSLTESTVATALKTPVKITFASGVTGVRATAAEGNTRLTTIEIADTVTAIGMRAFANCTSLNNVVIPASVTSIDTTAFSKCSGLTSLTLNEGLQTIGAAAFEETGITELVIPNTVTTILGPSFQNCTSLTSLVIGSGVTSIGQNAFKGCAALTEIYYLATNCANLTSTTKAFEGAGDANGCTVYVGADVTALPDYLFDSSNVSNVEYNFSLETASWTQIKNFSQKGVASTVFNVGDEKTITLTDPSDNSSFDMIVQIADFNHDIDKNGNPIGITFVTKELLPEKYKHNMNSTATNAGGWAACEMRTYLNNDVYNLLPDEIKNSITATMKKSTAGGASTTLGETSEDKLFMLSLVEINYGEGKTGAGYKDEGTPYALYTNWSEDNSGGISMRIKNYVGTGTAATWWLRSPYTSINYCFCYINSDGYAPYMGSLDSGGVCFAFCV